VKENPEIVSWERIGRVAVDSATTMVCDPCYLLHGFGGAEYRRVTGATHNDNHRAEVLLAGTHGTGVAFIGDRGCSWVAYAGYDMHGCIREVRLISEDDTEEVEDKG
jgi:hypothetical protein